MVGRLRSCTDGHCCCERGQDEAAPLTAAGAAVAAGAGGDDEPPPSIICSREGSSTDVTTVSWRKGVLLGVGSFGKVYRGLNMETGVCATLCALPPTVCVDVPWRAVWRREFSVDTILFIFGASVA